MSPNEPYMTPLPKRTRRHFFWFLLTLFVAVIPFLYLYAMGYRFTWTERFNFISTGGLFIAAEETGGEIYLDNELVRETRVFGKAYYAQNIDPGTHRVHVQKEGYHTWVKELPVYPHLVTEVQAYNLPLTPKFRPITRFETATGTPVVRLSEPSIAYFENASSTESIFATSTIATSTLVRSQEYTELLHLFAIEEATTTRARTVVERVETALKTTDAATTTVADATTTKEYNNVRLFQNGDDVFASWVGSREGMPYYYCAQDFEPLPKDADGAPIYSSMASSTDDKKELPLITKVPEEQPEIGPQEAAVLPDELVNPPVQTVPEGEECVPEIRIDRKWQKVKFFDFFPGRTDLVVMVLERGVYAVEVDDRSWQNVQPILEGENLDARISNGHVVVYDGAVFYEMLYEQY